MEPSTEAEKTDKDPALALRTHVVQAQQKAWKEGYNEGVRATLQRLSERPLPGEHGIDISTVKFLRFAIQDLPGNLEVLDMNGTPLRGEVRENYALGKSLFVYGRYYRPINLGDPF